MMFEKKFLRQKSQNTTYLKHAKRFLINIPQSHVFCKFHHNPPRKSKISKKFSRGGYVENLAFFSKIDHNNDV